MQMEPALPAVKDLQSPALVDAGVALSPAPAVMLPISWSVPHALITLSFNWVHAFLAPADVKNAVTVSAENVTLDTIHLVTHSPVFPTVSFPVRHVGTISLLSVLDVTRALLSSTTPAP